MPIHWRSGDLVSHPPIAELLRHELPMSVLDEISARTENEVLCAARVTEACPFVRHGALPAVALLEYMAQTIGVYVALERRAQNHHEESPVSGYLVGVRDVELHVEGLPLGARLEVRARLDWHEGPMGRFSCRVNDAERCLAEGQLTVYQPSPRDT